MQPPILANIGGRERVKRPVGEGDSRWHVHRGMLTYAATRVGAYLGEQRAPCVGVYVTRYAAASAAAYVGQDRQLHVWERVPLYMRVCTCGRVSWLRYAPAQNDTYQAPPSSMRGSG